MTFIDTHGHYQDIPRLNVPLSKVSLNSMLDDGDVVFVDASEDDEERATCRDSDRATSHSFPACTR